MIFSLNSLGKPMIYATSIKDLIEENPCFYDLSSIEYFTPIEDIKDIFSSINDLIE